MNAGHIWRTGWTGAALAVVLLAGCGGESAPEKTSETARPLPTAAIPSSAESPAQEIPAGGKSPAAEEGSPQWLLDEIVRIRVEPFPQGANLKTITEEQARRNRRVVALAEQVVAKTHGDPSLVELFDNGVRHLMEARLQLALQGDRDHIDALYEDAHSLRQRAPRSVAAAEAAFTVARFAHTNARRFGTQEPRWIEEFARQAKHYAESFPEDEPHAAPLLYAAAQSCELNGLTEEARVCYAILQEKFPDNEQGKEAAGVLRRLNLPGQMLEFSGPTIDGGVVNLADYRGRAVLIVFWATTAREFAEQLPTVQEAIAGLRPEEFAVIGVNLDENEAEIDAFLEQHRLPWKHIFYPRLEERGWQNPLARQYGVSEVPAYWLVDRAGTVVSVNVKPADLAEAIAGALGRSTERAQQADAESDSRN